MARYALVIGITKYKSSLGNLPKAAGDAEAVAQLLETHGNFQVTRLPSYFNESKKSLEMVPEAVTGAQLGQALQEFLLKRAKNSDALIYYTGHGITIPNKVGRSKGYLATSDEDPLELGSLNELILDSELKSLVVLLDCCYSGSFLESNLLQQTLTAFTAQKDYYFITASRGFEPSYAVPSEAHSIFTGALLTGLSKNNTDIRGRVSGDRLFDYISQEPTVSGQEPIRLGWGKAIEIVCYPVESIPQTTVIFNRQNPYQGLKDFEPDKAEYFFGREDAVRALIDRLNHSRFLAVVGSSGCGKSSLVKAGLLPKLADIYIPGSSQWQIEFMKPGDRPLTLLQEILVRRHQDNQPFVLFIDQYEEVFTLCKNETERQAFIHAVTTEATATDRQTRVIVTIRGDFIQRCADYPETAILINREKTTTYFVTNLNRQELEAAIEQPALLHGVEFERGLVALIANDVDDQPGALPLLQYALKELWRVCIEESTPAPPLLTKAGYEKIGGVKGALEKRANFVYENLSNTEQNFVRLLFLELVEVEENQPVTRRRANLEKLTAIADSKEKVQRIVGLLADQRLIVTSDRTIEVAHEALLTEWKLLASWIEQDYENIRLSRRLEAACLEWQRFEKSDDALLTGELLSLISEWYERTEYNLPPQELEFLQKSIEKRDREQQDKLEKERQLRELAEQKAKSEAEKAEQERAKAIAEMEKAIEAEARAKAEAAKVKEAISRIKAEKQRTRYAVIAGIFAAFTIGLTLLVQQREVEVKQNKAVTIATLIGKAEQLLEMNNQLEALIASVEVLKEIKKSDIEDNNQLKKIQSIIFSIQERNRLSFNQGAVYSVNFSPDGKQIVFAGINKSITLWNLKNKTVVSYPKAHKKDIWTVRFSHNHKNTLIASASSDDIVNVWNTQGKLLTPLVGHQEDVYEISFSNDDQQIASSSKDGSIKIWDIKTGRAIRTLQDKQSLNKKEYKIYGLEFSPVNKFLLAATGFRDYHISLWDLRQKVNDEPRRIGNNTSLVTSSVRFNTSGDVIASTDSSGVVKLWDLQGKLLGRINAHKDAIIDLQFSHDNKFIASAGIDRTIKIWSLNEALELGKVNGQILTKPITVLKGHAGAVTKISFNPNNSQIIASASDDETVRIWEIIGEKKYKQYNVDELLKESCKFLKEYQTRAYTICNNYKI